MTLPIEPPYPPMEAQTVEAWPAGEGWAFEPKWDGFRCLAFRDGDRVELQSKAGQPLARYFPEVVAAVRAVPAPRFVLDGELVVPVEDRLSFDALLQRIHPAASRITRLAAETPAILVVFDLLVDEEGRALVEQPWQERRGTLEGFAARHLAGRADIVLSPATRDVATARGWLEGSGAALDGVVAKPVVLPYRSGERTGMVKLKRRRTADCVVGGFRYAEKARVVGSLLLGLYDEEGLLHHVGFTSGLSTGDRQALLGRLTPLIGPPGFTGRAPGGPSRWTTDRSTEWESLRPELVVEVSYDHYSGDRFRHGTRLLRWRPDKAPRQCTMDQVETPGAAELAVLLRAPAGPGDGPGAGARPPGPSPAGGRRTSGPATQPGPAGAGSSSRRRPTSAGAADARRSGGRRRA